MTSSPVPPTIPSTYADHILVASPSTAVRQRVLKSLNSPARRFEQATGGAEALYHLESGLWQVLFLDRCLPDLDAEELSDTVRRRYPEIEVVLLDNDSGSTEVDERVGTKVGPLPEPWEALSRDDRYKSESEDTSWCGEIAGCQAEPVCVAPLPGMIGSSSIMQPVYRLARLLAARNTSVMITGPTGSGKEVVARSMHDLSPRGGRAFAVVNCAAIPETMLEAELFGYARGAFTGAMQSYAGRIQAAQGGTLFLDEIGEMPLSLQPKLLRFLEQKEI